MFTLSYALACLVITVAVQWWMFWGGAFGQVPAQLLLLPEQQPGPEQLVRLVVGAGLGAKACTPEINTSEIIVDFQRHVPKDC